MSSSPTWSDVKIDFSGANQAGANAIGFMREADSAIERAFNDIQKQEQNKLDEKTLAETIRHNKETTKAEYAKLQNALLLQQMSDDAAMRRAELESRSRLMQASISARNSGPKFSDVRDMQTTALEKDYLATYSNSRSKMTNELLQIQAMEETSPDTWNDAQKALYNEFQQSVQGTTLEQDAVNDPKKVLNYVKNNHISNYAKRMGLPDPQNIGSWGAFDNAVRSMLGQRYRYADINRISIPEFVKQEMEVEKEVRKKAGENQLNEKTDADALRKVMLKGTNGKVYDSTTHDELNAILKSVSLFTGISEEKVAKYLIPAARASEYKWNWVGSDVSGYETFMRLLNNRDFQNLLPQKTRDNMLAIMRKAANPEGFSQITMGPWQSIGLDRGASLIAPNLVNAFNNRAW